MDWPDLFIDLAFLWGSHSGQDMVLGAGNIAEKKTKISASMELIF